MPSRDKPTNGGEGSLTFFFLLPHREDNGQTGPRV